MVLVQSCVKINIKYRRSSLGPNIHWTSNYSTGIVFIGNVVAEFS